MRSLTSFRSNLISNACEIVTSGFIKRKKLADKIAMDVKVALNEYNYIFETYKGFQITIILKSLTKLCKCTHSGHYKHPIISLILLMYFERKLNKNSPPLNTNPAHQIFAEMPMGTVAFICTLVSSMFKYPDFQLI